ncbi:MAG TPA: hypothetical protein VL337_13600 [Acidimicrobiales bacterium]|nr:hypothetical protein [Acidimicrobiales bacterium]
MARGLVALALVGGGAAAMGSAPASADVIACQYLQYGATLGCATVPAPASPAGFLAVGVGNELVPVPAGQTPTTTQTYVCLYNTSGVPTCVSQTLGVPALFSVGAGTT